MRPRELTCLPGTSEKDNGSSIGLHSSPSKGIWPTSSNRISKPLAEDKPRQQFETTPGDMPSCCAAKLTDAKVSHVFAPTFLQETGLHSEGGLTFPVKVWW